MNRSLENRVLMLEQSRPTQKICLPRIEIVPWEDETEDAEMRFILANVRFRRREKFEAPASEAERDLLRWQWAAAHHPPNSQAGKDAQARELKRQKFNDESTGDSDEQDHAAEI